MQPTVVKKNKGTDDHSSTHQRNIFGVWTNGDWQVTVAMTLHGGKCVLLKQMFGERGGEWNFLVGWPRQKGCGGAFCRFSFFYPRWSNHNFLFQYSCHFIVSVNRNRTEVKCQCCASEIKRNKFVDLNFPFTSTLVDTTVWRISVWLKMLKKGDYWNEMRSRSWLLQT